MTVIVSPWERPLNHNGIWIKKRECNFAFTGQIYNCPLEMQKWMNKESDGVYTTYNVDTIIKLFVLAGYHIKYD